jgi:hypothetical protein
VLYHHSAEDSQDIHFLGLSSIVNQVHDNLVSYSSSVPEAAMAPPSPLPQTLEELATKQQEDHDAVVATLTSLFNENQSS